ncbi:MAG: Bifunctional NAD(P)H-hydrate repair enzyme Nnr [Chlamydiia bacterium]|nr:Bifunctional NAD(P)H-hydrate repair enzyme Nnr [Chlamydiia bacterium]
MSPIVITAKEMARIEKKSIDEGADPAAYMNEASANIAQVIDEYIQTNQLPKRVLMIIGVGNNGGDGFNSGEYLLDKGYEVLAWPLFPKEECSPLNQRHQEEFLAKGGRLVDHLIDDGVLVDAILGTGFHGETEGVIKEAIDQINASPLPTIAIDIPSGLNGNDGTVAPSTVRADLTIALGAYKWGYFLSHGYDMVGKLVKVEFGLDPRYMDGAEKQALCFEPEMAPTIPPRPKSAHKYSVGGVIACAGSLEMSGAAALSTRAALQMGVGICFHFAFDGIGVGLARMPVEVITKERPTMDDLVQAAKKAKALYIGPGIGREPATREMTLRVLKEIYLPCVIDADALSFLDQTPPPKGAILTPHEGELKQLLKIEEKVDKQTLLQQAQSYADRHQVVIVAKGGPTFVLKPNALPTLFPYGTPKMATAGSGDVLTGIIASLLAQGLDPFDAATLAVYTHAKAGERVNKKTILASDLIDFI